MSLLQTLFTCVFALWCNLLFHFLPAVPCPSPNSLRDLLVFQCFPSQSVPACGPPHSCPVFGESCLGIDWEAAAPDKDELPCLCSDRREQGLCSLPRWQAWLKLARELLEVQRVKAQLRDTRGHWVKWWPPPFARETLLHVLGPSSISNPQTGHGWAPGAQPAGRHQRCSPAVPISS